MNEEASRIYGYTLISKANSKFFQQKFNYIVTSCSIVWMQIPTCLSNIIVFLGLPRKPLGPIS